MLSNVSHAATPEVTFGWLSAAPVAASPEHGFLVAPMTAQHGTGLSGCGGSGVFAGTVDGSVLLDGSAFAGVRANEMELPQHTTDRKRTYAVVDGTRVTTSWPPI